LLLLDLVETLKLLQLLQRCHRLLGMERGLVLLVRRSQSGLLHLLVRVLRIRSVRKPMTGAFFPNATLAFVDIVA
jgi:hypothetical protein